MLLLFHLFNYMFIYLLIQSSNIWMLGYKSQHTIKLLFEVPPIFIKPWTILVFSLVYFQLVKAGVSLHLEGKFSVINKNFGFWANHDPGHKIQCTCGFTSFFLSSVLPFIQYITEGITIITLTQKHIAQWNKYIWIQNFRELLEKLS